MSEVPLYTTKSTFWLVNFCRYANVYRTAVNNYFTEMCSGFEAGSYLMLIDFAYHSTLGLRVIKKKRYRAKVLEGVAKSQFPRKAVVFKSGDRLLRRF